MDIKPTLKLRILLALFTLFIGAHAFIMQWDIGFYIRNIVRVDMIGVTSINLDHFTIEFSIKILISLIIGILIFPRFSKKPEVSHWDKFMFSFFIFLFLITFAKISILQMFSSGSSYFYHLSETLYFTPFFLLSGFYILPRYISGDEHKPWKSFLGGIKLCAIAFLYPLFYQGHLFDFIGYLLGIFKEYPSYNYWYLLAFPISGASAWMAQFYLYHHREKYWKNNLEIFA